MEHLIPLATAFVIGAFLIKYSNRRLSDRKKQVVFMFLGFLVSGFVVSNQILKFLKGYDINEDLPLFLCGLMGLIIPFFTVSRKYWMYEILVFWVFAGTLQAVITPDIDTGFPTFNFIRYWVLHSGLILIMFYAFFVFKMKPTLKSLWKSFGALQIYVISMFTINYFLGSNYFYLNEKPKGATLLDIFGPWPIYLLVTELMILPFFFAIYFLFNLRWKPISQTTAPNP